MPRHPDDPDAVLQGLRERGTTLLLVNYPMLQRWKASGWLDPRLKPEMVKALLDRMEPQIQWMNGETLFRVPPQSAGGAPETVSETSEVVPALESSDS